MATSRLRFDRRRRGACAQDLEPRLGIVGGLGAAPQGGHPVLLLCLDPLIHRGIDVARAMGWTTLSVRLAMPEWRRRSCTAARGRADRHGRFRWRHAEIHPCPSGAEGHGSGRRRQDDQAGARHAGRARSAAWPISMRWRRWRRPGQRGTAATIRPRTPLPRLPRPPPPACRWARRSRRARGRRQQRRWPARISRGRS